MEIRDILRTVGKRIWLVMLFLVLVPAVVFAASSMMQPIYEAKVTLVVEQSSNASSSYSSLSAVSNLAQKYSKLLKIRPILEIVIDSLNLTLSPQQLERMVNTELIPETQLLKLTVRDTDPQRASDIANEIAATFVALYSPQRQFDNLALLEQDVAGRMAELGKLIDRNHALLDQMTISSGLVREGDAERLLSTLSGQQSAYTNLLAAYMNIQATKAQVFEVSVIESAIAPRSPVQPRVILYTVLGAFVGLNLGVGLAFLLDHLFRSFETSNDVRKILSLPTLGILPRFRSQERQHRLIALSLPHSVPSEAFRALRTNLRYARVDETLETLLVTSPEPAVGKTTTASNLGVVSAQAGLKVVLIDADLHRPKLHQVFDLDNHAGLTDLLVRHGQNVEDCLLETDIDNLRVIPSGPTPPNPSELLGSKRMQTVLAQLKERADLVLIDCSPVLAVSDAAVLARVVDGVLFVISAGKTRQEDAQRALEGLRHVGADLVGVVLNSTLVRGSKNYYTYAYSRDEQERRKRRLPHKVGQLVRKVRPFAPRQSVADAEVSGR